MEQLYEVTFAPAATIMGLKLAHKLGREHVHLTLYSDMRVNLAAQVYTCTHMHTLIRCPTADNLLTHCNYTFL